MSSKTAFEKIRNESEMTEEISKKSSWWQIAALIFTALLIVGLIVVNFAFSENRFVITSSIVFLTCLLVIVVLSKSFDSFSLGFFSLRREVKENKEKIDKLENYVFQSINNNQQMKNRSDNKMTVNFPSSLNVKDMEKDEKEKEEKLQQEEQQEENIRRKTISNRRVDREKFAELLLNTYIKQNSLSDAVVRKDVKITDKILDTDFISNRPIAFKAYLQNADKELFIDTFQSSAISFLLSYDRIYVKVSKVLNYRSVQNTNAKMVCLIGKPDFEEENRYSKLETYFSPAINNKLLDIVYIPYSKEDYDSCVIQNKEL